MAATCLAGAVLVAHSIDKLARFGEAMSESADEGEQAVRMQVRMGLGSVMACIAV
jgi:hypothetical protein